MHKDDKQSGFAVLSSFLLEMSKETFPSHCLINIHEVEKRSRVFGLYNLLNPILDILPDTIQWLSDEGYIRSSAVEASWYITLSEKGMTAIGFSLVKPNHAIAYDLNSSNGSIIAGGKDSHGDVTNKSLKLTKPATTFIPTGWLD